MSLRVIGAGLGRTGTNSLKLALEELLDGSCYHMFEAEKHPEHFPVWQKAAEGDMPDWASFLSGYVATVDGPACHFWEPLSARYPAAIILLSIRDPDDWIRSAMDTIIPGCRSAPEGPFLEMERAIGRRFGVDLLEGSMEEIRAGYMRHNEKVLRDAPAERLVVWQTGDGWAPLCQALGMPLPDAAFPHVNSSSDFQAERLAN